MKHLSEAVYNRLKQLNSQTYPGMADDDATYPYFTFSITSSSAMEYESASARGHKGEVVYSLQINVFTTSGSTDAAERIEAVWKNFELDPPMLEEGTLLAVYHGGGEEVSLDPERETDGSEVWRGIVILECHVLKEW